MLQLRQGVQGVRRRPGGGRWGRGRHRHGDLLLLLRLRADGVCFNWGQVGGAAATVGGDHLDGFGLFVGFVRLGRVALYRLEAEPPAEAQGGSGLASQIKVRHSIRL